MKHDFYVLSLIRLEDDFSHVVIEWKKNTNGEDGYYLDGKRWFPSLEALQKFYEDDENASEIKASLKKCVLPKNSGKIFSYTKLCFINKG